MEESTQHYKAGDEIVPYVEKSIEKWFSSYDMELIKPFFYYKKKSKSGRTILAYIRKASEFEQLLLNNIATQYLLFVDGNVWPELGEEDRTRLIRHELRHIFIDYDKDGEPKYQMADHNLIDFREDYEIEQGKPYDDPFRVASNIAMEVYFRLDKAKKKQKKEE